MNMTDTERAALKAAIEAQTAAYLRGEDNAVPMTVQPPKGWDSAEA